VSATAGGKLTAVEVIVRPEPMKVVAALMQDPNPIHWDRGFVGGPVVNQGPLTAGFLTRALTPLGRTLSLHTRFLGTVHEGEVLRIEGCVDAIDPTSGLLTVALTGTVRGELRVSATARVQPT